MEPVIVVGGISPVAADEFGRSSTVITRQDIEDRGYTTVQQALEAQPGISMNGDGPSNRQIRIRGGEGNHTLILIDGVRAAAGDSEYILRGLDASYIERIEVLRGPQSVPFGTDAASGVVNIVTREADAGWNYGGSVEFGEGDRESAYLSHESDRARFSINVSNFNDRGIDYSGSGGERDGTIWESASSKAELDVTNQTTAGFTLRLADAFYHRDDNDSDAVDADGYVVDASSTTDRSERAGSIYIDHSAASGTLNHRLRLDQTVQKESTEDEQFGPSRSNLRTQVANYRFQAALDRVETDVSDQLLSLLLEHREDVDRDDDDNRKNNSAALEYRGRLTSQASVQVGIRRDDNDAFADETTWNVAGSYFINSGPRLHASAGRAVVNPSFFEISNNSELVPEKNTGYDFGVEIPFNTGKGSLDITYFNETLEDKIGFPDPESFVPEQIKGESDRQGLEMAAQIMLSERLDITVNYTYIDATNPEGDIEIRRPRNELGVQGIWRLPNNMTTLAGNVRYVRGLFDNENWKDEFPTKKLPSFAVASLSASQKLMDGVDLTARITNLFDESYREVLGYATRGRAAFIGLKASF
jgi:vitamin B12 transporter